MAARRTFAAFAAALALAATLGFAAMPAAADGSLAAVDAVARAAGNHRPEAVQIGRTIFATPWPVQVRKVRVDGMGTHLVAGLVLSGIKFHGAVTTGQLTDEVAALVTQTFAASTVEEVDVWAIVPLPTYAHEVVSGDRAHQTSRTVFAVTVRRSEAQTFDGRLRRGDDVYWDPAWRATLARA